MSDNKKYYYLNLKDNFFNSEEMIILQNMQDGYLYSDILFKMYLRSLKNEGKLMFNNVIPYTPEILAQIVRHNVGVVEKAIDIFTRLGLIEIMDDGAIYMLNIQNFIGHSSTEADRQRAYQKKIKQEKQIECKEPCKKSNRIPTPEKEIEIKKEKEKEIKKERENKKKFTPPSHSEISSYCKEKDISIDIDYFIDYYTTNGWMAGKNKMKDWQAAVRNWARRDREFGKDKKTDMSDFIDKLFEE